MAPRPPRQPAHVAPTADGDGVGALRLQFPDTQRDHGDVEPISWDACFETFEAEDLAFVYQDGTEGECMSRFYQFLDRGSVADR